MRALPLCEAGCGHRVKRPTARFCSPECVPRSLRAENCRRGRATFAYAQRRRRFARELERLQGHVITREHLLGVFHQIDVRAYNSGYQAGRKAERFPEWR